jgi:hypothetical protein
VHVTADNGVRADAVPANARVASDTERSSPPAVRTLVIRNVYMIEAALLAGLSRGQ